MDKLKQYKWTIFIIFLGILIFFGWKVFKFYKSYEIRYATCLGTTYYDSYRKAYTWGMGVGYYFKTQEDAFKNCMAKTKSIYK